LKGARAVYSEIPTYHERVRELTDQLREVGHLGLVLIDASELAQVEHDYGSRAFEQVLSFVSGLVSELQGAEVRASDLLALNERGGNAFLLFLSPRRGEEEARPRITDLGAIAGRVGDELNRKLARFTSPYLRGKRRVTVGYGVVFHNPLILAERVVARLVGEAWESVRIQKMQAEFQARCRLQDVLLGHQITTVFQPIVDLRTAAVHGLEALSRGPAGTPQHSPMSLFEEAKACELTFELDQHCRRRALRAARDLPVPYLLFVNVVPAAMYDPDFQGASLIRLLEGVGLSPGRIVLEVSEQYAIENYTLFAEALQNFKQMGFSIAVDDIGAGYSGLEKIAHLQPRYLKFDMQLVRDIDQSHVKKEMARALKTFADRMDSQIIAEGIEREGEQQACLELGLHYGQGYHLGRPAPLETFRLGAEPASSARG
jgi:EAL domain-containing protein (putative c-di-GMP-specific phosphodiesterase class I)